ncbi:hypothetical protein YPPY89_3288, partial [Yersinia pestis PY-89]
MKKVLALMVAATL